MKKSKSIDIGDIIILVLMPVIGAFCGWIGLWWSALLFFFYGIYVVKTSSAKNSDDGENKEAQPRTISDIGSGATGSTGRIHITSPKAEGYVSTDWAEQMKEIRSAWKKGDYDFARTWLQKLAYTITSEKAPDDVHLKFKALMSAFAKEDPLFSSVMSTVVPLIKSRPGVLQSQIMKECPQFDAEQFRYVMYYAAEMDQIRREKKGRSYALFIIEHSA